MVRSCMNYCLDKMVRPCMNFCLDKIASYVYIMFYTCKIKSKNKMVLII